MEKIFWNVLSKNQKRTLNILSKMSEINDFYLAGGTGLALQIGHRKSIDFDFFSKRNKLFSEDREKIKNYLRKYGKIKLLQDKNNTLDIFFDSVKISFFYYPYSLVKSLKTAKKIKISSVEDISLMKLSAISTRGNKKDFIDLYFVCKYIPLVKLFKLAKKKFPDVYDFSVVALKSLVYFFDAEQEKMPVMLKAVNWSKVKNFFIKETKKILNIQK